MFWDELPRLMIKLVKFKWLVRQLCKGSFVIVFLWGSNISTLLINAVQYWYFTQNACKDVQDAIS